MSRLSMKSSVHNGLRCWLLGTTVSLAVLGWAAPADAMTLKQAVQMAVDSNPEIGQAIEDRAATGFELQQALGLYAPRVDLNASTGAELLSNPTRRAAGLDTHVLLPTQVGISVSYDIFDSGYRDAESDRQAARLDGAALRVLERSEFIALEKGSTLGEGQTERCVEQPFKMEPGDRFVIFTDGVFSVVNKEGKALSDIRFAKAVAKLSAKCPVTKDLAEEIHQLLEKQREGTAYPDDVTLVVLDRKA